MSCTVDAAQYTRRHSRPSAMCSHPYARERRYAMHGKIFKWKQETTKSPMCAPTLARARFSRRRSHRVACFSRSLRSRISPVSLRRSELHVSYGGLLMRLRGEASRLSKLRLDDRVYLLLRKVS